MRIECNKLQAYKVNNRYSKTKKFIRGCHRKLFVFSIWPTPNIDKQFIFILNVNHNLQSQ